MHNDKTNIRLIAFALFQTGDIPLRWSYNAGIVGAGPVPR